MLYLEEDDIGMVSEKLILRLSKRAAFFLKKGNKVVVTRDDKGGIAMIVNGETMEALYVEPGNCLIDAVYPNFPPLIGDPSEWTKGLHAGFNTAYMRKALDLPGYVQFYRRLEDVADHHATLFTVEPRGGGKGLGLIMPVRMANTLDRAFPDALKAPSEVATDAPQAATA